MKIEKIIYDSTRGILNLEDKLSIATIFLFCWKLSSKKFSELLYTENHEKFIEKINEEYLNYGVDFSINFKNKNVKDGFHLTLKEVIKKEDSNGFLKALFEKDEFALMIDKMINSDIPSFQKPKFKEIIKEINQQLTLF